LDPETVLALLTRESHRAQSASEWFELKLSPSLQIARVCFAGYRCSLPPVVNFIRTDKMMAQYSHSSSYSIKLDLLINQTDHHGHRKLSRELEISSITGAGLHIRNWTLPMITAIMWRT
jgi:hypothetical protein